MAIQKENDFVAQVAASNEAVEAAERERPGVVLLALDQADSDGISVIRRIKERRPDTRVVILSMKDDDLVRAKAVEAGAIGYVSRVTPLDDLPNLLRKASRG